MSFGQTVTSFYRTFVPDAAADEQVLANKDASLLRLFCCRRCGSHGQHDGRGHYCCGCLDHESSLINLVYLLSVEIGKIFKVYVSDGQTDGWNDGRTD